MHRTSKGILVVIFLGIAAAGVAWMLLRMETYRGDPPGTTRTFKIGDIIYAQSRAVFRVARFEDNLMIISRMSHGNPALDFSITLAAGSKFTLGARIFEIQSWNKNQGAVTLTVVQ